MTKRRTPILLLVPLAWLHAACDRSAESASEAALALEAGVRIDINTAPPSELDRLPRVGPTIAGRIVADRQANGLYQRIEDIQRVRGIGPSVFSEIRPFITIGDPGARCDGRIDVNAADAVTLEELPGIGPVTAAAIVAEREAGGPFADAQDLERVRGIGPATSAALADRVVAGCDDGDAPSPGDGVDDGFGADGEAPAPLLIERRLVHVNDGDESELLSLPGMDATAADRIARHVREVGVFVTLDEIERVAGVDTAGWAGRYTLAAHRVYFTPMHDGASGYAARNRDKTLARRDGGGRTEEVPANIQEAFVDLVNRVPDGGLIQLAIYGYGTNTPEHHALARAVEERGVRLQVAIDTSVRGGDGVPYTAGAIAALRALRGDVVVRTPRYVTRTLHQKFAIFDGRHVMNGSANISASAHTRYDETRMVFWNDEGVTQAFEAEFERLFHDLGVEPE